MAGRGPKRHDATPKETPLAKYITHLPCAVLIVERERKKRERIGRVTVDAPLFISSMDLHNRENGCKAEIERDVSYISVEMTLLRLFPVRF